MYDTVGEQRFLATTLAGRMSQARLYVGKVDSDDMKMTPVETTNQQASALLDSIGDGLSGRVQLLYRLGVNLFIAGEGWLVGIPRHLLEKDADGEYLGSEGADRLGLSPDRTPPPVGNPPLDSIDPDGISGDDTEMMDSLDWRMLSVSEVSSSASGDEVTLTLGDSPSDKVTTRVDDLYLIRVWRPHPRRSWEADSPTRSSLPVLRELVGLTMRIAAQIDSRLAGAGLLFVPAEAQQALQRDAGAEDDEDVLSEALMSAMMEPISDRASASAVVPLTLTVPGETIEQFRHLSFSDDLDVTAKDMRHDALQRLAMGQDVSPEILFGMSDGNHWSAWLVQEDTISTHIEPPLRLICDALTEEYLRPCLIEQGMPEDKAREYVVWYDVSHLIIHPNKAAQALALHQEGVITDEAAAGAVGFDGSDIPEKDDSDDIRSQAISKVSELITSAPSLVQNPGMPALLSQIEAMLRGDDPEDIEAIPNVPEPGEVDDASDPDSTLDPENEGNAPAPPSNSPPPTSGGDAGPPASGPGEAGPA